MKTYTPGQVYAVLCFAEKNINEAPILMCFGHLRGWHDINEEVCLRVNILIPQ